MNTKTDIDKTSLLQSMKACVENGQRLHEDAEWLRSNRSATAFALCILAQEEFAKAFLLHLVCEEVIPWTAKVRESLHNHKHKQLIGLIMEWLSPPNDAFWARMDVKPGIPTLPGYVADAMILYVEKVLPQGYISYPPLPLIRLRRMLLGGDRDKIKQDAFYVRLSEDGQVISVPSPVAADTLEAELEKTRRLGYLVDPLREGVIGPVLDYDLLVQTIRFLLLDKRNRPFLLLEESKFGGPATCTSGTIWLHSIEVRFHNISNEQATHVGAHAAVFLDDQLVKPTSRFNDFTLDPYTAARWSLLLSEQTYVSGISPSQKLQLYINIEYHGPLSDRKYQARLWSTYNPGTRNFRETFTDLQESVIGGSQSVENKWTHPSRA